MPGERERPCEIVTPPLGAERAERLEALLAPARELGFRIARESATHIHFDAAPLRSARTVARMVRFFERWGPQLRQRVGTNPACRRLGGWPDELRRTLSEPGFEDLDRLAARARLQAVGLSKYCDFNLKNVVHDLPGKPIFEVRILPGLAASAPILKNIDFFETLLRRLVEAEPTEEAAKELLRTV